MVHKKKKTSKLSDDINKVKTYKTEFSTEELVHLRDLFNILLPPEGDQNVSQALAQSEHRTITENLLWKKIAKLCQKARLPLEHNAPNFLITMSSPPTLGIYPMNNFDDEELE